MCEASYEIQLTVELSNRCAPCNQKMLVMFYSSITKGSFLIL